MNIIPHRHSTCAPITRLPHGNSRKKRWLAPSLLCAAALLPAGIPNSANVINNATFAYYVGAFNGCLINAVALYADFTAGNGIENDSTLSDIPYISIAKDSKIAVAPVHTFLLILPKDNA